MISNANDVASPTGGAKYAMGRARSWAPFDQDGVGDPRATQRTGVAFRPLVPKEDRDQDDDNRVDEGDFHRAPPIAGTRLSEPRPGFARVSPGPLGRLSASASTISMACAWFESHCLRHPGRSRIFSAWVWWAIKPTSGSDFSFELRTPSRQGALIVLRKPHFISGALDSADSVRFSKIQRFEGPLNFNEKRFSGYSRTGERIRFQFAIRRFESSRPSQPVRRSEKMSPDTRRKARQWRAFAN
jgi:hypothetical protein